MAKIFPPLFQIIEIHDYAPWKSTNTSYLFGDNANCALSTFSSNKFPLYDLQTVLLTRNLSETSVKRINSLSQGIILKLKHISKGYYMGVRRVPDEELEMIEECRNLENDIDAVKQQISTFIPKELIKKEYDLFKQLNKIDKNLNKKIKK